MPPRPANETRFILLRKTPFQETSLIAAGLSASFGRVDFLLKGARNVTRRQFPQAELFREFDIIFQEAKNADGLARIISFEPRTAHDALCTRTENYLAACAFASFLLKNTRPMLPCPATYRALEVLLTRLEHEKEPEPWLTLAYFTFLHENGFVPTQDETEERAAAHENSVKRLLALAADPARPIPDGYTDIWKRLRVWVDNLILLHNLGR